MEVLTVVLNDLSGVYYGCNWCLLGGPTMTNAAHSFTKLKLNKLFSTLFLICIFCAHL